MSEFVNIPNFKLTNGIDFPMIGLGTFRTADDKAGLINAVKYAIKVGYRHIDGGCLFCLFNDIIIMFKVLINIYVFSLVIW